MSTTVLTGCCFCPTPGSIPCCGELPETLYLTVTGATHTNCLFLNGTYTLTYDAITDTWMDDTSSYRIQFWCDTEGQYIPPVFSMNWLLKSNECPIIGSADVRVGISASGASVVCDPFSVTFSGAITNSDPDRVCGGCDATETLTLVVTE